MAINPLIALGVTTESPFGAFHKGLEDKRERESQEKRNRLTDLYTQQAEREAVEYEKNAPLREQESTLKRLQNMDAMEEARVRATARRQQRLHQYLERGDVEGARRFLQDDKARIGRIREDGKDILGYLPDTRQTDAALAALDTDPEGLKSTIEGELAIWRKAGILPAAEAPKTREIKRGDQVVTEQFNPATGQFETISQAPRFNPNAGIDVHVGGTKFEEEQSKKVGGFLGDSFIDTQNKAREAVQMNAQLDTMSTLLEGIQTGRGTETLADLKSFAQRFGLPFTPEQLDELGKTEAAKAIGSQIALRFRNPESGLGLPGATSNRDISLLQGMSPGIHLTPAGRQFLTKAMRQINDRKIEVAREARKIATANEKRGIKGLTFEDLDRLENMWATPLFDEDTFRLAEQANREAGSTQQEGIDDLLHADPAQMTDDQKRDAIRRLREALGER